MPYGHYPLLSNQLHGSESFLRSWRSLSQSRFYSPFMQPKGSLPCLKSLPIVHILSQMHPVHTFPHYFS